MTDAFALGSIQGGILQPIQQHTWDITFASGSPNPTIFSIHPFYSGYELAMFFPEEIEWLTDQVDRYHLVYTDPDKWNSSSPFESIFQHENTLIALYEIELAANHGQVDAFFPKMLDEREVDESGWVFVKAGAAFVAVFPLKPYEWIENDDGWRLRSHDRRNGFVVEARHEDEFASFDAFKTAVRKSRPDTMASAVPVAVSYRTLSGDSLSFSFGGARAINGREVNLDETPLFSGPYLNGSNGKLIVSHGNDSWTIDLNTPKSSHR
jgi:hypothetical protein